MLNIIKGTFLEALKQYINIKRRRKNRLKNRWKNTSSVTLVLFKHCFWLWKSKPFYRTLKLTLFHPTLHYCPVSYITILVKMQLHVIHIGTNYSSFQTVCYDFFSSNGNVSSLFYIAMPILGLYCIWKYRVAHEKPSRSQ